jgi:DNA-binding transcriptional ArsR family regulator
MSADSDTSSTADAPPAEDASNGLAIDSLSLVASETGGALLCAATEPGTAKELSRRADVPLSTVYRETGRLVDAGLLTETCRMDPDDGRHVSVYERAFETIEVSVGDEGVVVTGRR